MSLLSARFGQLLTVAVALVGFWSAPRDAAAGGPRVEFDLAYTAECRDVTPDEFALTHPDERIIEAYFRISTLVSAGRERDLEELMITVNSSERRLRVLDFTPQTVLLSDIAEPICTVTTDETAKSLDAGLGGSASAPVPFGQVTASPSAGARIAQRDMVQETIKRLPPREQVVAAGTLNGEHGVFFKLKRNSQDAFEGAKEFAVRFVAPIDWRADWVVLTCEARGPGHWYTSARDEISGQTKVLVGLYQEGDLNARAAARRMAAAEGAVFDYVRQAEKAGRKLPAVDIEAIATATAVLDPPKPRSFVVTDLFDGVGDAIGGKKPRQPRSPGGAARSQPDVVFRRAANRVAQLSSPNEGMATAQR
jgi:hypothetical protein